MSEEEKAVKIAQPGEINILVTVFPPAIAGGPSDMKIAADGPVDALGVEEILLDAVKSFIRGQRQAMEQQAVQQAAAQMQGRRELWRPN